MNTIRTAVVALFLLSQLYPPKGFAATELPFIDPETPISMDFQEVGLKDVLKIFSIQSGLNFIASEAVKDRKITLYFDKVPIRDAMNKLFKANNLYYELDKNSNIFIVKDWGKPDIDTITKVYSLKYQSVSSANIVKEKSSLLQETGSSTSASSTDLVSALKQVMSSNGKISEDPKTNSLIITDIPSRFNDINQIINRLDTPQPQVMLEVEVLDVNKNKVDKLGIKYGQTPLTLKLTGAKNETDFPFSSKLSQGVARTFTAGTLDFATEYSVSLDLLKRQTDTKTLARPKILTLNNETAEIKISTKEAVNTTTTTNTGTSTATTSVERQETGISLRVTPQINTVSGEVTMVIVPKVIETKASLTIANTSDPEERSTKSVVRIKDGETVIIGGLIRNELSRTLTKLPILGDIPVLGAAFRHKDQDKDMDRELLIFITPHIIKEDTIALVQASNIALPEREQNTISVIDRRTIIESSLNEFDGSR